MPFETLDLGIELTLPTSGTTNWGQTLKNTTWTKISAHDHSGSGNGAPLNASSFANNSITTAKLSKNYGYTEASTVTPVGFTQTLDFNNGNVQRIDLGSAAGDVTLTLTNMALGSMYLIFVIQASTPRDLIWPANVKWPGAQKLLLSQTDNAVDYVRAYYDGTNLLVLNWDQDIS